MASETAALLNEEVVHTITSRHNSGSHGKKILMISYATIVALLTAGIIFGFAAIKPVFVDEGAYAYLCDDEKKIGCAEQKLKLDLMFTFASFILNVGAFPVGIVLDLFGPRVTSTVGTVLEAVGLICLAYSSDDFRGYIVGYLCLALGGLCMFISNMNLMNLFPAYMGTVNGILTGAFDASSLVFMVFKQAYYKLGIHLKTLWLYYLIVPAANQVFATFFLTEHQFEAQIDFDEEGDGEEARKPLIYNMHDKSAKEQMMSIEFWLVALFTTIHMLRLNFYIATVEEQLRELADPGDVHQLVDIFNVILPIGGIVTIPVVCYLLDHQGSIFTFNCLSVAMVIFGVTSMIPGYWVHIFSFCLFVITRTCLYASISDFAGRMFGFKTFGITYGMLMMIGGLGNLLQYPFDNLVVEHFNNSFFYVNSGLIILSTCLFILPVYLYREREIQFSSQYTPIS
eukprot:CFRG4112T1